jgi:ABC-type histidine transport system ATPase subunit
MTSEHILDDDVIAELHAGPAGNVLEAIDVRRRYGTNEVLRGVSFGIRRGEVKAILGPSGSGNSTLLRCLALL